MACQAPKMGDEVLGSIPGAPREMGDEILGSIASASPWVQILCWLGIKVLCQQ